MELIKDASLKKAMAGYKISINKKAVEAIFEITPSPPTLMTAGFMSVI